MRAHRYARRAQALLASLPFLIPAAARAHDFWIEPSSYRPAVPSSLAVRLRVGDDFGRGESYTRNPAHIRAFVIAGPSGTRPIPGPPGTDPAGMVRVRAPGIHVLGYRSAPTVLELEASRFEEYLREEHLDHVARQRAERGESGTPGREAFSRCAKAIVVAGDGHGTGYDRVLGCTLELVPERNPATMRPGAEMPVRLLYDGAPLAGAHLAAVNAADTSERIEARTDARGRARLRLGRGGVWLVRTVYMRPAAAELGADWESLWASLTFLVPPSS